MGVLIIFTLRSSYPIRNYPQYPFSRSFHEAQKGLRNWNRTIHWNPLSKLYILTLLTEISRHNKRQNMIFKRSTNISFHTIFISSYRTLRKFGSIYRKASSNKKGKLKQTSPLPFELLPLLPLSHFMACSRSKFIFTFTSTSCHASVLKIRTKSRQSGQKFRLLYKTVLTIHEQTLYHNRKYLKY